MRTRRPRSLLPGAAGPSAQATDPAVSYLADLLSDTRQELGRVDDKASLLLAAVGLVAGTLIGSLAQNGWALLALRGQAQWLWWAGVTAAVIGVFLLVAAVHPRIKQPEHLFSGVPTYYAHVAAFKEVAAFQAAIGKVPDPRERLVNQIFWLSRIVHRKYIFVRTGLWFLLASIATCSLAIAISVLLGR